MDSKKLKLQLTTNGAFDVIRTIIPPCRGQCMGSYDDIIGHICRDNNNRWIFHLRSEISYDSNHIKDILKTLNR